MKKLTGIFGLLKKSAKSQWEKTVDVQREVIQLADSHVDDVMMRVHALGLDDEVGEEGSPERELWLAIENVYDSFNKLSDALDQSRLDAKPTP